MRLIVTDDEGEELLDLDLSRLQQGRKLKAVTRPEADAPEPQSSTSERLLTVEEAAEWLSIPKNSLYNSIKDGTFPDSAVLRFGERRIRILQSALIQWAQQEKSTAPTHQRKTKSR